MPFVNRPAVRRRRLGTEGAASGPRPREEQPVVRAGTPGSPRSWSRRLTDLYLAAVKSAVARPHVIDVRVFKTKANAYVTAECPANGYLCVDPSDGDTPVVVTGRT